MLKLGRSEVLMMASGEVVVQQRLLPALHALLQHPLLLAGTEKADIAVAALDQVAGQLVAGIEVETPTFMSMGLCAIAPTSTTGRRAACSRMRMVSPGSLPNSTTAAGLCCKSWSAGSPPAV